MKLIKQSFEFINQTDFSLVGIKKHIERCARVSYKSEDKITDTSYEKFVNMLESRGHDRPLEFGTVYLKMPDYDWESLRNDLIIEDRFNEMWIKWEPFEYHVVISTNYRCIKEWINSSGINFTEEDFHKYIMKTPNYLCWKRHTVHMILDRGVMDEFRTHVGLSHLAESTRYCNYSKDKFGRELTFIKPYWLDVPLGDYGISSLPGDNIVGLSEGTMVFIDSLLDAEATYLTLLDYGWTPQQARTVLPLGIKSELISCGFEDAWENFFKRRDASDAHPMAQEIAKPMHEEFNKLIKAR